MGEAAAVEVSAAIRKLLEAKSGVRMIFAAAPSQNEFLEVLARDKIILLVQQGLSFVVVTIGYGCKKN
ncbi:MAG: hypothetical protein LBF77_05980 [Spirochaetaceae bacterium]|jgi:hypothetical protein|nr:hypothetical protein [Spirochaetaceae bacterium]